VYERGGKSGVKLWKESPGGAEKKPLSPPKNGWERRLHNSKLRENRKSKGGTRACIDIV